VFEVFNSLSIAIYKLKELGHIIKKLLPTRIYFSQLSHLVYQKPSVKMVDEIILLALHHECSHE
jgi:hypothetical protein